MFMRITMGREDEVQVRWEADVEETSLPKEVKFPNMAAEALVVAQLTM